MNEKFQNKYRIESARLSYWDYRWAGAYFITICTDKRSHYFGEVLNGKMILSDIGLIADALWYEIIKHHHNVELGEFVVMPNHIHGVVILRSEANTIVETGCLETGHALSLQQRQQIKINRFQNIGRSSISSIIGSYKSAVTKEVRRLGGTFAWQTRFYDHIIRNNQALQKISEYIINNPQNWEEDEFYKN